MLPNPLLPDQLPKPQFRCVIPCGYGVDLFPLVEPESRPPTQHHQQDHGDDKAHHQQQIKPLLPVAGKKMIDWVLDRVQQAGVFGQPASPVSPWAIVAILTPCAHTRRDPRPRARIHRQTHKSPPPSPPTRSLAKHHHHRPAATQRPRRIGRSPGRGRLEECRPRLDVGHRTKLDHRPSSPPCPSERVPTRQLTNPPRLAHPHTQTDFILAPCDLLLSPNSNPPSPISLAALLDRHRSDDNLLTTLFSERAAGNVIEARKDGQQILFSFFSHGPQGSA